MTALIEHTNNFAATKWLGRPVWQNVADAWLLQECIVEDGVDFVVECGTNRGGSAFFMATIFDLLGRTPGRIVTVDIESLVDFTHPRVEFLLGSSANPGVVAAVKERVVSSGASQPLVMLDSEHAAHHVAKELRAYCDLVPVGGYICVQDGCVDTLPMFAHGRPGPIPAIREFVAEDARFVVDEERSDRYLFMHSPLGWLKRVR